jgi:hypothetical protein
MVEFVARIAMRHGIAVLCAMAAIGLFDESAVAGSGSALSSDPIPMKTDAELPARTAPLLEIGPRFLDTGNISPGFELPTGAIWQPALWVFGSARSAVQYYDNGSGPEIQEWASRLDLFANLQLTGTERLLLGVSPLNRGGQFSRYARKGPGSEGFLNETNVDVTTLFFEGEFGEIFPDLDPDDSRGLDFGFSVGRQPVFFQEGIMFNDTIDAVALTRDTIVIPGLSPDARVSVLYGWNQIDRNDNRDDDDASFVGVFSETDFRSNTLNVDLAYVFSDTNSGSDLGLFGIGSTQRFGHYNTAFWVNHSWTPDSSSAVANDGTLLFGQLSRTLPYSEDLVYLNAFWGIDQYTSAARAPTAGGPLGQMGILFASVGLGSYGSALSNRADDAYGASVGYQLFFNEEKTQLVVELGGRESTQSQGIGAVALGARLQVTLGERYYVQFDGFVSALEGGERGAGLRSELALQF